MIIEKSENKYVFWDDDDRQISGELEEIFTQWVESPGSIFIGLQNEKILDHIRLSEKAKSVMNDFYPIYHLLIQNEENNRKA